MSGDAGLHGTSEVESMERQERSDVNPLESNQQPEGVCVSLLNSVPFVCFLLPGFSKEEAMDAYVALVETLKAKC